MSTPKPIDEAALPRMNCSARRMFSLPLSDKALADYVEAQGKRHKRGVVGYLRDLVIRDREQWFSMEELRKLALSKLTEKERFALGFPSKSKTPSA